MPASDFSTHYQFGEQQYASPRTGWGVACIISGGITMVSGLSVWLFGDTFNKTTNNFPSGFEPMMFPDDFKVSSREDIASGITKRFGLMDGGVVDNQGIDPILLAEKRMRKYREDKTRPG